MFRLLTILLSSMLLACTGSAIASPTLEGSAAKITDFPYMVSIELSASGHYCSGVIVNVNWVLTDAWCTSQPMDVDDFALRSGSAALDSGRLHRVLQWIHHSQSHVHYSEYDFALVQVDPPFELGEKVDIVILPDQDQGTPDGAEGIFVGWGESLSSADNLTKHLQYVRTSVVGEIGCSDHLAANYSESKLCVNEQNQQVAFWNEEGGPLMVDGLLFGIAQWSGDSAHPRGVKVYSRVASVRSWMDRTMESLAV